MSPSVHWAAFRDFLGHHLLVLKQAWRFRHETPADAFEVPEAEFLPAALALRETPLSPAPRVAIRMLLGFTALALAWACWGQVDVVVLATGKVVADDRSQVVAALDTAAVRRIAVTDGQTVSAGDILLELDATASGAEVERLQWSHWSARLDIERLRAVHRALESGQELALRVPETPAGDGDGPAATAARLHDDARVMARSQLADIRARLLRSDAEMARRSAEADTARIAAQQLGATLPLTRRAAQDYAALAAQGHVSRHAAEERELRVITQEGEWQQLEGRRAEAHAALVESKAQRRAVHDEARRTLLDQLEEATRRERDLAHELVKARGRDSQTQIRAPVTGVVQQLAVHTLGGVVTPGTPLMIIVPSEPVFVIEASLENKDVGFVRAGQPVAVKVDTFAYTRYGLLDGSVRHVSGDAIADEKRGLLYTTLVELSRSTLLVDGHEVPVRPGMSVSVEIKTGRRRVIEYFLSPLLQYGHESLRER